MADTNSRNSLYAGGLFIKYPCLNMIWAINGSGCVQRRYDFIRTLLSSLGIGIVQAQGVLGAFPKEMRLSETEELAITGKKPCDVYSELCVQLGLPNNLKTNTSCCYIPCLHCRNNCGSQILQQPDERYQDETAVLAFLLNNSFRLSKTVLKRLSRKTNSKNFLSLFSYRSYYFLRGDGPDASDVISYPIVRYVFSRILDIAAEHGDKPDEIYQATAQPFMSPVSVIHQILSCKNSFAEFLDGRHAEFADRYEPIIKNTFFKITSSLIGRAVSVEDFRNAVERLTGGRKSKKGILAEFPFEEPDYETTLPAEVMSVFSDFGFEKGKAPAVVKPAEVGKPVPAEHKERESAAPAETEIPKLEEIRKRYKDEMMCALAQALHPDSLMKGPENSAGNKKEASPTTNMPESDVSNDNVLDALSEFEELAAEETVETAPVPGAGSSPAVTEPRCKPTTASSDAGTSEMTPHTEQGVLFSNDGYLLLPDSCAGEYDVYTPHMSDSWFMEQCRAEAFSLELAVASGKPGFLFFGIRNSETEDILKKKKPFFISCEDVERVIVGTGYHSLLFDVGHKTYYTYNKAFFVDFLLKSWSFQPQTLISSIRSLQVVQSLFFEDSHLFNAELFASPVSEGENRAIHFFKNYRRIYHDYENRIYEKHKSGQLLLRRSEAFEYAVGTSLDISEVSTVEGNNCRRLSWITAEYEYSDFRKLKARGVKIGFRIITDEKNPIPENSLFYATIQCIGRCMISQVIGKAHPVLLSYGCGEAEFFLPSFGDLSDKQIQSRLHNAFTSFNVCFKDTLTEKNKKNVMLRNLYPFDDQFPISCEDER